jgi:protein FAM32A
LDGQLPINIKSDKTAAELSFDLVQKKRIMERIDGRMKLTHRQKLEKYNKSLNKLPEHYDIHKIGEKIQKGY